MVFDGDSTLMFGMDRQLPIRTRQPPPPSAPPPAPSAGPASRGRAVAWRPVDTAMAAAQPGGLSTWAYIARETREIANATLSEPNLRKAAFREVIFTALNFVAGGTLKWRIAKGAIKSALTVLEVVPPEYWPDPAVMFKDATLKGWEILRRTISTIRSRRGEPATGGLVPLSSWVKNVERQKKRIAAQVSRVVDPGTSAYAALQEASSALAAPASRRGAVFSPPVDAAIDILARFAYKEGFVGNRYDAAKHAARTFRAEDVARSALLSLP